MIATYYITRIDGSKYEFTVPVGSRKQARQMIALTTEGYTTEGWYTKEDGEFDIWMVRGLNDPTFHLVIE